MRWFFDKYLLHNATLLLLLVLSTITAVAGFTIGSPSPNSLIQRNAQFIVTWSGLTGNVTSLTIELAQGPSANALLTRATLAMNVPAGSGSETVSVPSTVTSANNYYLRLRGNDIPASVAVQGPITIYASAASSSAAPSSSSFSLILPRPSSSLSSSASSPSSSVLPTSISSSAATATNSDQQSVTSSSAAEETSHSDNDSQDGTGKSSGGNNALSSGAIAGIAIGAVAGAGIIVGVMICVRRGNRDGDDRFETSSEIFASPPGYRAETKDVAAVPAVPVRQRQEYASSPRQPEQQQGGQFYSTGYENAYYNAAPDPYYQHQQAGYDQYNNYGYHPAAVYMPNLSSPAGQQQQLYTGYHGDGNQYWDANQQQHYPPEPVYYNSTPPHPQQQAQPRPDPPHSPNSPHN